MGFLRTLLPNASLASIDNGWPDQLLEEAGPAPGGGSDAFESGSAARMLDVETPMHARVRIQGREGGAVSRDGGRPAS